jgi:hypothetical protein
MIFNINSCVCSALIGLVALAPSAADARTFRTHFPAEENPISENGAWLSGKKAGLDWTDVRTVPGLAFGTQAGKPSPPYDDSVAVLTGTWGRAQFAQATVKTNDCTDASNQELELYLHGAIAAHSITGYEFNFRCSQGRQAYAEIVRWNGKLNDFTYLAHSEGASSGVKSGDVITAIVVGDVLESYINGRLTTRAIDATFRNGSPGIGFFFYKGAPGSSSSFGFSNFEATDAVPAHFPASSLSFYRLYVSQALTRHPRLQWLGGALLIGLVACTCLAFRRRKET